MATGVSAAKESGSNAGEEFLADEETTTEFEEVQDDAPVRPAAKDPSIRRKIEDRLERNRLRDELGIFDEDWDA